MIRAGVITLVLLAGVACGKYGPPVRSPEAAPDAARAVSASPAPAETEACPDPNAPAAGAVRTP